MKAICLTSEAIYRGFELYKNKCKSQDIEYSINESIFSLLLDGAVQISQENTEARPINTNILIFPPNIDIKKVSIDLRVGITTWVNDNSTISELDFKYLKRYLEIAGDKSSYLIISVTQSNSFVFNGFLFLEKPLYVFISEIEEPINPNLEDLKK